MANKILWQDEAVATVIPGDATNGLRNLANGARKLGTEYDNTPASKGYQLADLELHAVMATSPAAGAVVEVYLVCAPDGTNYEAGDSSTTPAKAPDAIIPLRAATSQPRIVVRSVPLPPWKFKALLVNTAGVAFANTNDTDSLLKLYPYNDEIQ